MMAQYLEIKSQYPDALLFYRMGDFYELFFEDAIAASAALDIALTKRGKHDGDDIPMCGVPAHSAETYLLALIRKGFRVAVGEQMETPDEAKKRGYKAVVRRDVVRLVTPGTLTEDALLNARKHNFLASYCAMHDGGALAWVDISTGAFHVQSVPPVRLGPELARLSPAEVILPDDQANTYGDAIRENGAAMGTLGRAAFDSSAAEGRLCSALGVKTLAGFGQFDRAALAAMGGLVEYLNITQKGNLPLLRPPVLENEKGVMQIDAATRRNLELTTGAGGTRSGSLLAVIDRTQTASGARLLERRLSSPIMDLDALRDRQDAIDAMIAAPALAADLRDGLRKAPDLDRALSRLALDRGGPRDLSAIRAGLAVAQDLAARLRGEALPTLMTQAAADLQGFEALLDQLDQALVDSPPLLARDGGFIAAGFDPDLDDARALRDDGRSIIAKMQAEYAQLAEVSTLKIKHNNVLGYFIETTTTHAQKMLAPPLNETFIHRQTTANQIRFTTTDLAQIETRIHNAGARAIEIEKAHFAALRSACLDHSAILGGVARALAEFDVTAALADLAQAEGWVRPQLDNSHAFTIEAGRHPVVEAALAASSGEAFIANSCDLSDHGIWLLTGPNMAGKSTFLRQNALIAILAQMGSFVPARAAHIGLVSQVFSRVGASDDLARGRSTFMVEMVETAAILNQSDARALVILDEIGRGTATYDGLSIAWACLEHLHNVNKARAIFATHYHEMTALAGKLDRVENATVAVKEWDGQVIFLHEVRKGAADRSYGVQVAQLAGLPPSVVERARAVLHALEEGERSGGSTKAIIDDLPLFAATPPAPAPTVAPSAVEDRLAALHPDTLTPRDALDLIYELKGLLGVKAGQ